MTTKEPYPRDLIGYGSHPPHPHWPGEARIAVSLVLNYEEGGEACVLHGDAHSESVLTDIGAVDALPGVRNLNVESLFEYGSRVGFWEIMRLLKSTGVPATVYAVGMALERNPEAAAEIARQRLRSRLSRAALDRLSVRFGGRGARRHARNIETITRLDRPEARGLVHRPPEPEHAPARRGDRRLSLRQRCLQRRSSLLDAKSQASAHLVIPYSFDNNDSRLQRGGDFSTGEEFFTYCRDAFDWLYRMGARRATAHDERRPARSHHRSPRPDWRVGAPARAHPASRGRLAVQSGSHRRALEDASRVANHAWRRRHPARWHWSPTAS